MAKDNAENRVKADVQSSPTPDSTSLRSQLGFYASLIVVSICLGIGGTALPMGNDHGNYAYAAWAWLEGAAPYRDVMVFKPPMTMFVHAVSHSIFGNSMVGIRFIDLAWQVTTACLIAWIIVRWTKRRVAGFTAGVLYMLMYIPFHFWHSAQTDGWFMLPVAVAVAAATIALSRDDWRPMVIAGMAVACASLFKYTALAGVLPVAAIFIMCPRAQLLRMIGGFAAGFVGFTAAIVGWLVLVGAWPAFVDLHVNMLPKYAQYSEHGRNWAGFMQMIDKLGDDKGLKPLWLLTLFGIIGWIAWHARDAWLRFRQESDADQNTQLVFRLMAFGWLIAGIASCFSQAKFFQYHYLSMLAPAALMAAVAFSDWTRRWPPSASLANLGLVVVIVIVMTPAGDRLSNWWSVASDEVSATKHWNSRKFITGNFSLRENLALVEWLKENTAPDDQVFIWGREPMVQYFAERKTSTRFQYNYPFRFPPRDPALEEELLVQLDASPPEIFVVSSRDATLRASGTRKDSRQLFKDFTELKSWVGVFYWHEHTIGRFKILRRI